MVSDDERREVAARLHNNLVIMRIRKDWYCTDSDAVECGNAAYRDIAGAVEKFGNMIDGNYIHIVERLAELIDRPTTHIDVNEHGRAYCTSCGCVDWCLSEDSPYCPNCGKEVVE